MTLRHKYEDRGRRNHPAGTSEAERKLADSRVREFLDHAEAEGVRRMQELEQKHFTIFMKELELRGVSEWTRYKYQLAIKRMAIRHGVNVIVTPVLRKKASSRREQIMEIVSTCPGLNDEQRTWLTRKLEEVK
jgi:hypothetical protein